MAIKIKKIGKKNKISNKNYLLVSVAEPDSCLFFLNFLFRGSELFLFSFVEESLRTFLQEGCWEMKWVSTPHLSAEDATGILPVTSESINSISLDSLLALSILFFLEVPPELQVFNFNLQSCLWSILSKSFWVLKS